MSEWTSLLAVFWVLWLLDGARWEHRRAFTFLVGASGRLVRAGFSRARLPSTWPGQWWVTADDLPLAVSPFGLCNRSVGAVGRPSERGWVAQGWRWEEVREVGRAGGWIFINGVRFCPDSGHVTAPQILAWAQLTPEAREARIRLQMSRWFQIGELRRRARVLAGRTQIPALLNAIALCGGLVITIYVVGGGAAYVPTGASERWAKALPAILGLLLVVHLAAIGSAWRAVQQLSPVRPEKRRATLLSALLLPPQAWRLRGLVGDGYFPVQHPLAFFLAFGGASARGLAGFNVLADLRWPIEVASDSPVARKVTDWFRAALAEKVSALLAAQGVGVEELFAAPCPDSPASCLFCPRCRDQFVARVSACPHGVPLAVLSADRK